MFLALAAIPVLFGLSDYFAGRMSTRVNSWAVVAVTFTVCAAGTLAISLARHTLTFDATALAWGGGSGLLLMTAYALFYRALSLGKGGVVGAIVTMSVAIPIAADALRGKMPSPMGTAGIVAILVGVVLMCLPEGKGDTSRRVLVVAAAAAATFGFQYLALDHGSRANTDMALLSQFVVAAIALGIVGVVSRSMGNVTTADLPRLLGIGLIFLMASLLFANSLADLNPAEASAFANCEPVVLAICGWLFLRERLSVMQWVALLIVIAGAVVAVLYGST